VVRREALLACHVTRLFLTPDSLWASFMHHIYDLRSLEGEASHSTRGSTIWREMRRRALDVIHHRDGLWGMEDLSGFCLIPDPWILDIALDRWPTFLSSDMPVSIIVMDRILPGVQR